jgi:hypothetical protein
VPGLSNKREGLVTRVDKEGNLIEVKDVNDPGAPSAWFVLTPGTKLEREGRLVSIEDLSEGTPVRVSFEPATGPERTYKVEILTGPKADEVKVKAEHEGIK